MSLWLDFNNWIERNEKMLLPLALILLAVSLVLCFTGCTHRGSLPPAEYGCDGNGLGAQLASVGGYFTWIGLIVSGLALVACFIPILAPFRGFAIIAGEAGGGTALVGGLFVWLADNIWLVVLSCVLAGLAYAWYRRAWIKRIVHRLVASEVKP